MMYMTPLLLPAIALLGAAWIIWRTPAQLKKLKTIMPGRRKTHD